ncbi:hypothetical protein [Nostoc piscinale]|uniref:hypothetical protein n=1 Tax=Nostoc piscinale TaxID=224012 RepID=UPI000AECD05F|nr:hypothetical protein [Nostoc piscinale]
MFQDIIAQITYSETFPYIATALGFTSVAGTIGWRRWKQKNIYKPLESLPSPPKHWLLGNIPQILAAVKQKKLFWQFFCLESTARANVCDMEWQYPCCYIK